MLRRTDFGVMWIAVTISLFVRVEYSDCPQTERVRLLKISIDKTVA
jgi:hypothetical protein